jgi:hypothetical protein
VSPTAYGGKGLMNVEAISSMSHKKVKIELINNVAVKLGECVRSDHGSCLGLNRTPSGYIFVFGGGGGGMF